MTQVFDQARHTDGLARYFPPGRAFAAVGIPGTAARSLLEGLAAELVRLDEQLCALGRETIPDEENTLFLAEWERALGLPDECFTETTGLPVELRAQQIKVKLAALGFQTEQDFETIGEIFGVTITATPGPEVSPWPATEPSSVEPSAQDKRFTVVFKIEDVTSNNTWNWTWNQGPGGDGHLWSDPGTETLKCLFQKLKPANVQVFLDVSGSA